VDCNIPHQQVRLEGGPYMSMLTLTSKTHFGVMRGSQEQISEARGPKRTISYKWGRMLHDHPHPTPITKQE